jgi:hypothetical protein
VVPQRVDGQVSDPDELKDLEELIQMPGWARIKAMLQDDYGPTGKRYIDRLEQLVNNENREQALANVQLIVAVRKEIEGFFRGVEARVKTLQAARNPVASMSRRGPL